MNSSASLRGLVPVADEPASEGEVPAQEPRQLAVAVALRVLERLDRNGEELFHVEPVERDAEIVQRARDEWRVGRARQLDGLSQVVSTRGVREELLRGADRRKSLDADLVEAQPLGQVERLTRLLDSALAVAGEHVLSRRPRQDASDLQGGSLAFDESLGRLEVRKDLVRGAAQPVQTSEEGFRFRCARTVAGFEERVTRLLEGLDRVVVAHGKEGLRAAQVQHGRVGVVHSRKLDRPRVVSCGGSEGIERRRAIAGGGVRPARKSRELCIRPTRRAEELERRLAVVHEHLRVIVGTPQRLDPRRDRAVLCGALRPRDLPVRDVANECMTKGELDVVLDRGLPLSSNEALPVERVQGGGRSRSLAPERAAPEDLADDCSVLQQGLLLALEAIESSGDDALERLGEREVIRRATLEVELRELLGVERVAAGLLEELLLLVGQHRLGEKTSDEHRRLLVRERRERNRRRVELSASPGGTAGEQLGSCGADDEQGHVGDPFDELVDEVEHALVGPVQVFDDEDQRTLLREGFEEAPPGCECLTSPVAAELALSAQADEREQLSFDPACVGRLR